MLGSEPDFFTPYTSSRNVARARLGVWLLSPTAALTRPLHSPLQQPGQTGFPLAAHVLSSLAGS